MAESEAQGKKPKQGKSIAWTRVRTRSKRQGWRVFSRHRYGHSEKILRRNRKLWARLFSKEGRRLDGAAIREGLDEDPAATREFR